jgi:predicted alpha/beta hydrolase family esterase
LNSTVLFVPGLRDHVADHWQTLLAQQLPGSRTVPPLEHDKLSREARVEALDKALRAIEGPVLLAAHSAGCVTLAHWALQHRRPIKAALLVTPPDLETPLPTGYPTQEQLSSGGWLPAPIQPLPFRSVVLASTNDPLATLPRAAALARDWGSELVVLGDVGHMNPAAGFGPWPQGADLLAALERGDPMVLRDDVKA